MRRVTQLWRNKWLAILSSPLVARSSALFIVLGTVSVAMAQTPGRLPGKDPGYLQWAIAIGVVAVVCVTAFLNPKRTHHG